MENATVKTYALFILGSISCLIVTFTSIIETKYLSGMEDVSYKQFLIESILNNFSSYWGAIIVIIVLSIIVILFSIKQIYLLKKNKK